MVPSAEDLADTQHITTTRKPNKDTGESQADIQFDGEDIVRASYKIGESINIVVLDPNEGEIITKHEYTLEKQSVLRTRKERTFTAVTENAAITLPRRLLVRVVWCPDDCLNVTVCDPHSEDAGESLGRYEFEDPVASEDR